MINYVVGLAFNATGTHVVLIRKNRPVWQKDKFNGVGGKLERGEFAKAAMIREFEEETGVHLTEWEIVLKVYGRDYTLHVFRTFDDAVVHLRSKTDEPVFLFPIERAMVHPALIPNLHWIIPFSLSPCCRTPLTIYDEPSTLAKDFPTVYADVPVLPATSHL